MGSEWREVGLKDLGEVARGRSRHRPRYAEHLYGGPYPFIQTGDVKASGGLITSHTQTYSEAGLAQSRLWPAGTLCITIAANIAETGILTYPACFPDSVIGFIADNAKCDVRFVEYRLRYLKAQLQREAIGSVQDNINLATFERLRFSIPDLEEQKRIAHVLGSLDDKIALNHQINTTLESMAQTLFKSWFVDFDPVIDNALAAGNKIPEPLQARAEKRAGLHKNAAAYPVLPDEIKQQFPDSFVFTEEMGWVPEGWEFVSLKDLTQKIGSGATPRGGQKVYQDSGISLIRSQNIYDSNFVWNGLAFINDDAALQLKNVEVIEGDVLINITGASILRTCMVEPSVLPARVNQHVAIIRPKNGIPSGYLHSHLLSQRIKNHLMAQNAGASREAVTKGHLEAVPVLRPDLKILNLFEGYSIGIMRKRIACGSNSKILEDLRNSLLPKLLSGQLSIPEAEQALNQVM